MSLLLDTHVAIWAITGDARLNAKARSAIESADAPFVSVASVWEIAIKFPLGRRSAEPMVYSGREAARLFEEAGFTILPVTAEHAAAIDELPPLHGDPFDRMLIAQARTEQLHLMTHDALLASYPVAAIVV